MLEPKTIAATVFLVLLWTAEGLAPFYPEFGPGLRPRLRHDLRNLALGVGNALVMAVLFGGVFLAVEVWGDGRGIGLLRVVEWPGWIELAVALILFDAWMYAWHRANHEIPFLWRFHRMHHSDPELDATTGLRFHPGEQLLSAVARLAVLPLLGMELWQLAIYEAILLPVILFHHSNVRFPRWLDHGLLTVVVTPAMHRVHHSRLQPETDSNYGSILPYWDRIFGSFRLREDASTIEIGLDEFDDPRWQSLGGLLRTPLARGSGKGKREEGEEAEESGEKP
jgi:sterol desaturase/sphingolipid hydroxylase (fatty acid hydroxylase superfamily)